ncbi:unnamed protein product [Caenorhabditis nigoni]
MMLPAAREEPTAHEEGKPETQEETRVLVSRKRKADGTAYEETIKRPRKDTIPELMAKLLKTIILTKIHEVATYFL